MLSPQSFHIRLELRTKRTIIIKTRDTTVDFETWNIEEFLSKEVFAFLALVLFSEIHSDVCTLKGDDKISMLTDSTILD